MLKGQIVQQIVQKAAFLMPYAELWEELGGRREVKKKRDMAESLQPTTSSEDI